MLEMLPRLTGRSLHVGWNTHDALTSWRVVMTGRSEKKISDEEIAFSYILAQARELMLRFEEAHGRSAEDAEELECWVAGSNAIECPIVPRARMMN
jgi:hypothetical protein